ncbi:hypothetical protein ACPV1X_004246 [Escherichia coli]
MKNNSLSNKKTIKKTLLCSLISAALSSTSIQSAASSPKVIRPSEGNTTDIIVNARRDFVGSEVIDSLSIYGSDVVNILNGASVTTKDAIISGTTETSNPLNIINGLLTINGKAFFNSGTINIRGDNSKLIYQGRDVLYLSSGHYQGNGDLVINITEGGQLISNNDILLSYE